MNKKSIFIILLLSLPILGVVLTYCGWNFDSVRVGMKEQEVRQILGSPDRYEQIDQNSASVYKNEHLLKKHPLMRLMIYDCFFQYDLFVYLDSSGYVVDTERWMLTRYK